MKKKLHNLTFILLSLISFNGISQNITYVTFPGGLNDLANYASLYNTQNSRNDSMHVQRFQLSDFSMSGTKQINSIKGRFINPSTTPNNNALAELVIFDVNGAGQPGTLLFSTQISVSNVPNGDATLYKDITTPVTGVTITDNFFAGIRTLGTDKVQFYVGNTGCACDNAWLYGPSALNAGDDTWRTLISRHASQDMNYYFEVNVSNLVTNVAPVANDDNGGTIQENGADGTINVLSNDTDADGNPTATSGHTVDLDIITPGVQTTITSPIDQSVWTYNTSTGVVTCNPATDFDGTTIMVYTLCDAGGLCDNATITFTVQNTSSIEENTLVSSLYPNPVKDILTIKTAAKIASISVLSLDGKEISNYKVDSKINVSNLNAGIYFLEVKAENGLISKTKFIKE
ncbi:MAG: T9SS type A sorting domain-containing protein [Flavobacteriia bacterium]